MIDQYLLILTLFMADTDKLLCVLNGDEDWKPLEIDDQPKKGTFGYSRLLKVTQGLRFVSCVNVRSNYRCPNVSFEIPVGGSHFPKVSQPSGVCY